MSFKIVCEECGSTSQVEIEKNDSPLRTLRYIGIKGNINIVAGSYYINSIACSCGNKMQSEGY